MNKLLVVLAFFSTLAFSQEYEEEKKFMPVADVTVRLSDRQYVTATLKEIFGPSSESILLEYIFKKANAFNGPCDVYEQIRTKKTGVHNPHTSCFDRNDTSTLPLIGSSNLLRSGYMIKTCLKLTDNKKTLAYASKMASISKSDSNEVKAKKTYKLFYPFEEAGLKTTKALSKLIKKHDLKWALHTLCIDPSWQVL